MIERTARPRVFAEEDYCYGAGSLILRVQQVDWSNPVQLDNDIWYYVDGIEITRTGDERGQRRVLIRGRRLPRGDQP